MSSYRCPRCNTPLIIPEGRPGGVCPKCRRGVMLEELESRPQFGLFFFQIILIALVTVGVIGLIILVMSPVRPHIQLDFLSNLFSSATSGTDTIGTNNYANTRLEYYYYIPQTVIDHKDQTYPVLVMVPGLSGNGEHFVPGSAKSFASAENFIIIAPSFTWDEKNWATQQSYQYPSAWSGDALLRIIKKVEQDHQLTRGNYMYLGFRRARNLRCASACGSPIAVRRRRATAAAA